MISCMDSPHRKAKGEVGQEEVRGECLTTQLLCAVSSGKRRDGQRKRGREREREGERERERGREKEKGQPVLLTSQGLAWSPQC